MSQSLSGTDWYMESFGLTVSFSLYGDLLGTSAWARREQAKCVKNGICKPTDPVKDSEPVVAKKVKVEEPKKAAPEADMNSLNNEVNAPTEEELNFENDEAESQEDPDDDFDNRRALTEYEEDVADSHVNGDHEDDGDFEEVDDTVNDF